MYKINPAQHLSKGFNIMLYNNNKQLRLQKFKS